MKVGIAMKKLISILTAASVAFTVAAASALPAGALHLLKGDVNKDGMVTLRDATLAQRIQLGLYAADSDARSAADMDKNNDVTLADAYIIQRVATREKALLDDHDGVEDSGFCPNREERVAFYEALNAERRSKGLSEIQYTDAMLAAGQELCIQWRREQLDPLNEYKETYSNLRPADYAGSANKMYATIFADYGMKSSGLPRCSASFAQPKDGDTFFDTIRYSATTEGTEGAYYNLYTNILMNPDFKIFLVGEKKTGNSASWVIVGAEPEL